MWSGKQAFRVLMVSKHETVHKIKETVQLHHFVFATVSSYLRAKANSISSVSYRTFFIYLSKLSSNVVKTRLQMEERSGTFPNT